MDAYDLMKVVIICVGFQLGVCSLKLAKKLSWSRTKLSYAFVGFYWAAYYLFSVIRDYTDITFYNHQVFVRSGILITVTVLLASVLGTFRRLK